MSPRDKFSQLQTHSWNVRVDSQNRWKDNWFVAEGEEFVDEISPLDYKNIHVHHVGRAVSESGLSGFGTLETLCFGRHAPSGFDSILDGAP